MRRRVGFLFIVCAAIPVAVFASTAWACGALTTLTPSKAVVAPNEVINVTGRNFAAGPGDGGSFTAVQVRWAGRTGAILTEAPNGRDFTVPVKVPRTSPGWYVLTATQFNATTGVAKSGSPARAVLRVQGAAVPDQASSAPWGAATPTSGGGPGAPDLPLPGILLSVALLVTGLSLVFRDRVKKAGRAVGA